MEVSSYPCNCIYIYNKRSWTMLAVNNVKWVCPTRYRLLNVQLRKWYGPIMLEKLPEAIPKTAEKSQRWRPCVRTWDGPSIILSFQPESTDCGPDEVSSAHIKPCDYYCAVCAMGNIHIITELRLRVSVTCTFTIKHGTHVPFVTCSHLYDAYQL